MAKDPRSMTPKGKPGRGATMSANQPPAATKKKKQAHGGDVEGYNKRKPPTAGRTKAPSRVRGGGKSTRSSSDQTPGKTNYSYAGKK